VRWQFMGDPSLANISAWVRKKVPELVGMEEPDLVEFIMGHVRQHASAGEWRAGRSIRRWRRKQRACGVLCAACVVCMANLAGVWRRCTLDGLQAAVRGCVFSGDI
jgi:hypothetical protein